MFTSKSEARHQIRYSPPNQIFTTKSDIHHHISDQKHNPHGYRRIFEVVVKFTSKQLFSVFLSQSPHYFTCNHLVGDVVDQKTHVAIGQWLDVYGRSPAAIHVAFPSEQGSVAFLFGSAPIACSNSVYLNSAGSTPTCAHVGTL
jgi:hypothetical protein